MAGGRRAGALRPAPLPPLHPGEGDQGPVAWIRETTLVQEKESSEKGAASASSATLAHLPPTATPPAPSPARFGTCRKHTASTQAAQPTSPRAPPLPAHTLTRVPASKPKPTPRGRRCVSRCLFGPEPSKSSHPAPESASTYTSAAPHSRSPWPHSPSRRQPVEAGGGGGRGRGGEAERGAGAARARPLEPGARGRRGLLRLGGLQPREAPASRPLEMVLAYSSPPPAPFLRGRAP